MELGASNQNGYTILEVLVAVAILAIVISYSSTAVVNQVGANYRAVVRSEAAQAAQSVIDDLRNMDVPSMKTTGADPAINITVNAGRTYSVVVEYCKNTTYCTSSEARHVAVSVNHGGKDVYNTETVFTGISNTVAGAGSFDGGGGCWKC